jgi:hypothetical protein
MELAQDFGLSDVALAKRCRKLGVPVPGRGYWARVAAGQEPYRPTLKPREPDVGDHLALTFKPPVEPPAKAAGDLPPDQAAVRAQIEGTAITLTDNLATACPPVQRLAHRLQVIPRSEITWARRGDRQGPVPTVEVSKGLQKRALQVTDTLLRAAESLGWPYQAVAPEPSTDRRYRPPTEPPPPSRGVLLVAGEALEIDIREPRTRTRHVETADEKRRKALGQYIYQPPWDYHDSGRLQLVFREPGHSYRERTFNDGKRQRLEDQIHRVLGELYDRALEIKKDRAAAERRAQEERIRAQRAAERRARRDTELKLIEELERQAGAWFRAKLLHRYVRHARRALAGEVIRVKRGAEAVDFYAWAAGYLDQLDPLHPAPRNTDLAPDPYHWHAESPLPKGLSRLLGLDGQEAWKVLDPPYGESDADEDDGAEPDVDDDVDDPGED